jgi:hypothetical protein
LRMNINVSVPSALGLTGIVGVVAVTTLKRRLVCPAARRQA